MAALATAALLLDPVNLITALHSFPTSDMLDKASLAVAILR